MTPKKLEILGCFGVLLAGCAPEGERAAVDLRVERAALANADCAAAKPLTGLPEEAEAVVVVVSDARGVPSFSGEPIPVTAELRAGRTALIERVPVGESQQVALHVCAAGKTAWYGATRATISENRKQPVTLRLRPVGFTSCTGATRDAQSAAYAGPARPRAFGLVAPLTDGRVFFGAGASTVSQGGASALLTATPLEADYDAYDPRDTLFDPAIDRTSPEVSNRLRVERVAGHALPAADGASGLILLGGARSVAWSAGDFGPLLPEALATPFAEYFDLEREVSTAIRGPLGEPLRSRFLPAVGTDPETLTSVLVGGIEYVNSVATPSSLLEVLKGRTVFSLDLAPARVGATVTPLGGERFLVWGGDLADCGASPGALIDLRSPNPVQSITLQSAVPPPSCGAPGGGRPWWTTGFHVAARLPDLADGARRVLIVGGLEVLQGKLESGPLIGGPDAPANAFVLTLPPPPAPVAGPFDSPDAGVSAPTTQRVVLQPLTLDAATAAALKRIWHGVSLVGETVVVSGGWGAQPGGIFSIFPTNDLTLLTIAPEPTGVPLEGVAPPALTPARVEHAFMSSSRLGHLSAASTDGAVVFAGGAARLEPVVFVSETAEVWQAPPVVDPCAGAVLLPGSEAGPPLPEVGFPPFGDAGTDALPGVLDASAPAVDGLTPPTLPPDAQGFQ